MPYEWPKLAVVGVSSLSGADFATTLDKAIQRSAQARLIEGTCEEAQVPRLEAPAAIKRDLRFVPIATIFYRVELFYRVEFFAGRTR
jgi:hypothetical protein